MAVVGLLDMLKMSLEYDDTFFDEETKEKKDAEFNVYIESAKEYIQTFGINLDLDRFGDCQLVVMYADWLYTKRKGLQKLTGVSDSMGSHYPGAMPRALKRNLNNRLFSQKASEED